MLEGLFSPVHLLLLGGLLLLIFGRRLPEVGRNLGRGITEFKRGLKDVQQASSTDPNDPQQLPPPNQQPQYGQQQQAYQPRAYVSQQQPPASAPRLQPPAQSGAQQPVRVSRQDMVD